MDESLSRKPDEARTTLDQAYDAAARSPQAAPPPASAPAFSTPDSGLSVDGRLPRALTPKSYDLRLSLQPEAGAFTGKVSIKATVSRATSWVVLHSLELSVTKARVGGREIPARAIKIDKEREVVVLELSEPLQPGETSIELEYAGKMNPQMRGLYESKGAFEGKPESYAFTHLEPTNARRMVPSFDEPELKAVFTMTIEAPAELTVLSNMPALRRASKDGRQTVSFKPSPKMSSYLLAVVAARLAPTRQRIAGVDVAAWTAPGQEGQTGFAMQAAEQSLKRMNSYFGVRYDLPKLDMIAAPDFASGAMENWGAILFRDSALLVDPKLSSTRAKRRVAVVVVHEIAHQWFGDDVTMRWWNDLWLNEAFATWLSYKVVSQWIPSWKLWLEFEQSKKSALSIDALRSTRAIASKASTSAEIQAMFDPLTYDKGGSILRMLESYLGERKFRDGIRLYMKRHRRGNAEAADLWRALENASGQPVTRIADAWLRAPGFPIVEARKTGPRTLALSQRRFLSEGGTDSSLWAIPVVLKYKLKGDPKIRLAKLILDQPAASVTLPGRGELEWAYANAGEAGFYRVGLSEELLASLFKTPGALAAVEKIGLLGHLWAQAKNGERPISALLDALEAFKGDKERAVLEEAAGYLRAVDDAFELDAAGKNALASLARALLGPHLRRLGLVAKKGESEENKLARGAVVGALSALGRDAAFDKALEAAAAKHLADPSRTDPAFVTTLLVAAARGGDASRFELYLAGLRSATTPERRDQFVRALSEFRDPALARRALALSLTEELRPQDAWKPLVFALSNPAVQAEAWSFLQAHWGRLKEKVGPRGASQVVGALGALRKEEWRAQIEAFFAKPENVVPIAARKLAQALDEISAALRFRTGQKDALERRLKPR